MADPLPAAAPDVPAPDRPLRFGLVGSGWRADFFRRAAQAVPERFALAGVVSRTAERGAEVSARWGVPTHRTVANLLAAAQPELVVVCVPWAAAPGVTRELVAAGVAVLAETPPAPDAQALRALWADVGASGLVQVAEHSPFLPAHQARATLVRDGVVGQVTQVQVSSTHLYHAVSLVRLLLGVGHAPLTVLARSFEAPLLDPTSRAGRTGATEPRAATTTLALLDAGDGRSALYDFTDNQWRNPLRADRIVVRGSHGEIVDDRVTRWVDPATVVTSPIVRTQRGVGQDMDAAGLEHLTFEGRVVHRARFPAARLSDDETAVAELLDRSRAWVRGEGPPPYPLPEGSQDHLVALALQEAVRTGAAVTTTAEAWSSTPPAS